MKQLKLFTEEQMAQPKPKHDNIGMSAEFERLINYINENSNINVCRTNYESIDQMRSGTCGASFNFKVFKK